MTLRCPCTKRGGSPCGEPIGDGRTRCRGCRGGPPAGPRNGAFRTGKFSKALHAMRVAELNRQYRARWEASLVGVGPPNDGGSAGDPLAGVMPVAVAWQALGDVG
jgi:hypothetical protein